MNLERKFKNKSWFFFLLFNMHIQVMWNVTTFYVLLRSWRIRITEGERFVISFLAKRSKSGFSIFKAYNIYNKREFKMMLYLHLIKTLKSFEISITYCKYNTPINEQKCVIPVCKLKLYWSFCFLQAHNHQWELKRKAPALMNCVEIRTGIIESPDPIMVLPPLWYTKSKRSFSILLVKK